MAQEILNPELEQAPEMGGPTPLAAAAEELLAIPPASHTSPFLTRGNLALVALLTLGAAGVYGLSLRNGPASALADSSWAQTKVETALNLLDAQPTTDQLAQRSNAKAIVNEFYMAARQRQVPVAELRSNAFIFQGIETAAPRAMVNTEPSPAVTKEPEGLREALAIVHNLKLQSVLVGKQTVAMISNNLLTTGQSIQGWTVTEVRPREVEMVWRDQKYVLKMP